MFFIGIDVAKRSHQVAVTDISGNVIVKPFNFKNSSDGFTKFLSAVESNAIKKTIASSVWNPQGTTGIHCISSLSKTVLTLRCSIQSRLPLSGKLPFVRLKTTISTAFSLRILQGSAGIPKLISPMRICLLSKI